jgi:hypothetical protein
MRGNIDADTGANIMDELNKNLLDDKNVKKTDTTNQID